MQFEQRNTFRKLDDYRASAFHLSDYQLQHERYVIFSDAHKGSHRQTLDEFMPNEAVYRKNAVKPHPSGLGIEGAVALDNVFVHTDCMPKTRETKSSEHGVYPIPPYLERQKNV